MLSAVVITFNEQKNISQCLQSLVGIADEVVVIDSGSTDLTEAICASFGARFVRQKWLGYAKQKNWGNTQAKFDFIHKFNARFQATREFKTHHAARAIRHLFFSQFIVGMRLQTRIIDVRY